MKIVIDGNIGCGKSSLIEQIMKNNKTDYLIYPEPVDEWKDWLKLFYSDMSKYALGFQMKILKSHFNKRRLSDGIFERSPLSCQKIFGELLYEDLILTQLEIDLTYEYYSDYGWIPDVVIYLKADPKVCYERIHKRSRTSEELISLDYIKRLDKKYEEVYKSVSHINVITLDANQPIEHIMKAYNKALKNIMKAYTKAL